MSTFKELIYLVSDEMKNISDDSIINLDHIAFVLDKHRASVMKQYYNSAKRQIPDSCYQTVCLDLVPVEGNVCSCVYLQSVQTIPNVMSIGSFNVGSNITVNPYISLVSKERFNYVGNNKYAGPTIYTTISNNKLLLKSSNSAFTSLEKVTISAVFEDALKAAELDCNNNPNSTTAICDPWDSEFPIESALIPIVVELTLKELLGAIWRPADESNNAKDDLSNIHDFIARNVKSELAKQLDGNI